MLYLTHRVHTIHRRQNLNYYIFNRMPVYCTERFWCESGPKDVQPYWWIFEGQTIFKRNCITYV